MVGVSTKVKKVCEKLVESARGAQVNSHARRKNQVARFCAVCIISGPLFLFSPWFNTRATCGVVALVLRAGAVLGQWSRRSRGFVSVRSRLWLELWRKRY